MKLSFRNERWEEGEPSLGVGGGGKEGGKFEDKSTSSYVDLAKTVPLPILVGVHVVEIEIGN